MKYKVEYEFNPDDWRQSVNSDFVRQWFFVDLPANHEVKGITRCKAMKYVAFRNKLGGCRYRAVPMEGT